MPDEQPLSVESQLAVLRVKIDQLIELNKTRGEDHESRIRAIESSSANFVTRRAVYTLVTTVCIVVTATANIIPFLVR